MLLDELIFTVFVGVSSGVYSGLIVYRMARFQEIKSQFKRGITNIDFIGCDNRIDRISGFDACVFSDVASDYLELGHTSAGMKVMEIDRRIGEAIYNPDITIDDMGREFENWQKICRELKPNYKVVFNILPKVS